MRYFVTNKNGNKVYLRVKGKNKDEIFERVGSSNIKVRNENYPISKIVAEPEMRFTSIKSLLTKKVSNDEVLRAKEFNNSKVHSKKIAYMNAKLRNTNESRGSR